MPTIQMPLIICFSSMMRVQGKDKRRDGAKPLRDEFYMDGLNCDPMSFDKECKLTNAKYHKTQNHPKSKVTIISSVLIRMINQNVV